MKINWIGCKQKLLPQIISHLPKTFKTYYEPFLGSGVLYFHLQPKKAILNDNDDQLISMWRQIFQYPKHFVDKVKAMENFIYHTDDQAQQKSAFKLLLHQYNHTIKRKKTTKAAIFYILNKYSFRGVTRYNRQNHFTANFGYKRKYQKIIVDLNELITYQRHFKKNKHILQCQDFRKIIANSQRGDFIFVDPPYYYDGVKDKDFYQQPFNFEDHKQLAKTLHEATWRGVKWLYTNYATTSILELFKNCNITKVKTSTTRNLTNKKIKQEVIITNY